MRRRFVKDLGVRIFMESRSLNLPLVSGMPSSPAGSAVDPVCGMQVAPATAPASLNHEGKAYYFCCPSCLKRFQADPNRYLSGTSVSHTDTPRGEKAVYTCPMHPEVSQDHPGSCPLCGMGLEAVAGLPATRQEYICPMHPEVVSN